MTAPPGNGVCRVCQGAALLPVLDLGMLPLADGLVPPGDAGRPVSRYPLRLVYCADCHLLQLGESPPPAVLFGDRFPYFSSYSDAWVAHARHFAEESSRTLGLGPASRVVEVGSNDGYLLRHFAATGIPVLGIDPAPGPARAARAAGVPTEELFFSLRQAEAIRQRHGPADLVVANNALAHFPDPNELVGGAALLLGPGGTLSIEVPYLRDLVEQAEFDTIYHEHHAYFSVTSLAALLERHDFAIRSVRRLPCHGGSLRVTARRGGPHAAMALEMVAEEARLGMRGPAYYLAFAERVARVLTDLREWVAGLREAGIRLAAYGAAAKGSMLLNGVGIDRSLCEFVVDRNPHKHGQRMPGADIPILPVEALLERRPDYCLVLAWNWFDEIRQQQREYLRRGGKFILPLPSLRIVAADDPA